MFNYGIAAQQPEQRSLPSARGLSLPAGRQGLTLHFDKLSVLSMPKEAALFYLQI